MAKTAAFVLQRSYGEGVGPLSLIAVAGFQTCSHAFPDSDAENPFFYCIRDNPTGQYENGNGYVDENGNLVRDPVESSNNGNLVNFGPGLKEITCDVPALYQRKTESAITSDTTGIFGAVAITNIVEISQEDYDSLDPEIQNANAFIIPVA